jgi:hypothetical protein
LRRCIRARDTTRRAHAEDSPYQRKPDDNVYSDVVILARDDGELTTVTVDKYTRLRRV